MSFNRLPATTDPAVPGTIKFFWGTTELFDSVQLRTSYRAKMIKDQAGEPQLDDFAMSPHERRVFVEYLRDVIYELATAMFKLTQGISASVFIDDDTKLIFSIYGKSIDATDCAGAAIAPQGTEQDYPIYKVVEEWGGFEVGDYVSLNKESGLFEVVLPIKASGFSIVDNNSFNENVLELIQTKMENCIKYYIMREWYGSLALEKDMAANDAMYKSRLTEMKNLTHELRKPLMT